MSDSDRVKWDARYAEGAYSGRTHPSEFLRKCVDQWPPGRALDIACGAGRNALFLARAGWSVDAIDISSVALERAQTGAAAEGLKVAWHCQDVLTDPLMPGRDYQLIMMFRFVAPDLLHTLPALLAPGGMLMVEEHMVWPKPVTGPGSNRFRVAPDALHGLFGEMEVLVETAGEVLEPDGTTAALARLLVKKPL
jgi:tellurite methyltransferase